MECYRIKVPAGVRLAGYTVAGRRVPILPGEYHVHRMRPKVPMPGPGRAHALRFVGAYGPDADIHVPLPESADVSVALPPEVTADAIS